MKNLISLLLFSLLGSCGKQSAVTYNEASQENLPSSEVVSFSQLKTDILTPHCVRCHSNASTEAGLQSWVVAGNPEASPLFMTTKNGSMPKDENPLSTRELEEIRSYIANTTSETTNPTPAPVPTPTPVPSPTPTPTPTVSFSEIKSQVLIPYRCTSCHSMSTESGTARFINTSNPDQSSLYTTVEDGSMPRGGSRVPADKQALLLQYVRDYAASH